MIKSIFHAIKIVSVHARQYAIFKIVISLIDTASVFVFAKVNAQLLNELSISLVDHHITNGLLLNTLTVVLMGLLIGLIKQPLNYLSAISTTKYNDYLSMRVIDKSIELEYSFFDNTNKLNGYQQYLTDSNSLINTYTNFIDLIFSIGSLVTSLLIGIVFSWQITLITIIITIPSFFLNKKMKAENYKLEKELNLTERKIGYFKSIFFQKQFYLELHLFESYEFFKNKIRQEFMMRFGKRKELLQKNLFRELVLFVVLTIVNLLINLYLISCIIYQRLLIGDYTYYTTILNNLKSSINQTSELVNNMIINGKRAEYYFNFEKNILLPSQGTTIFDEKIMEIKIENLSFKYPYSDRFALSNVNMRIEEDEHIALTGLNGAGKSTLILLLLRYYSPSSGRILVNGIDINEFELTSYRKCFSTMFQVPILYSTSLMENIIISDLNSQKDNKDIQELLSDVGLYSNIDESILNSQVTKTFDETGIVPSIGQAQKINLARTLYREAQVVMFDEPSSSLDAISEDRIFSKLIDNSKDKILILVSHKFSNLKKFDHIFHFYNGELIEDGSHKELMDKQGDYCKMYNLQSNKY